jgi:asparagine synthase (glutamine-hydrolysing)
MCGIAGYISKQSYKKERIQTMIQQLSRRGPDFTAVYQDNKVSLAHSRLSIIDLSTGNQPMWDTENKVVIVYNGEIYNYQSIREDLLQKGFQFHTQSDTEVLLNGYKAYGIEGLLLQLEGMFAFALYDTHKKEVFIARDKFGEKPLYYYYNKGELRFASELKGLILSEDKFHMDKKALNYYLALTYIPAPYTIYKEIRKLEPAHYLKINEETLSLTCNQYYDLAGNIQNKPMSYADAKKKINCWMRDSIRTRMIADVPMGAFLSGGIDSSVICSLMDQEGEDTVNTFSIGFSQKEYDESDRAQLVADRIKANHCLHTLDYQDIINDLNDIVEYFDEPFGDPSALPSYYVAKLAKEDVKVVLTGDCADEIFAGYEKYLGRYYAKRLRRFPKIVRNLIKMIADKLPLNSYTNILKRKVSKVMQLTEATDFEIYYGLMCLGFNDEKRKHLLHSAYENVKEEIQCTYEQLSTSSTLTREQYTDFRYVLEGDMFTKVDRTCMMNSLESRSPFICTPLIECLMGAPEEYKIKGRSKKHILKDVFKEILPEKTIGFKKNGFSVPLDYWFRVDLKEELLALTSVDFLEKQGIFNTAYIQQMVSDHLAQKQNNKNQLWAIFVFQKWYIIHQSKIIK